MVFLVAQRYMNRCTACKSISVRDLRDVNRYVKVHDTLFSLKTSAEQGCPFCRLCWTSLVEQDAASAAEIDLHSETESGVYLRGYLMDKYDYSSESTIHVFVGSRPVKTPYVTQPNVSSRLSIFAVAGISCL